MSTRAGCECIAHALQGLTELDQHATVTLVSGWDKRFRHDLEAVNVGVSASCRLETQFYHSSVCSMDGNCGIFWEFDPSGRCCDALVVGGGGDLGAGLAFTICPICRITKMEPHVFRVLLLRRLHFP